MRGWGPLVFARTLARQLHQHEVGVFDSVEMKRAGHLQQLSCHFGAPGRIRPPQSALCCSNFENTCVDCLVEPQANCLCSMRLAPCPTLTMATARSPGVTVATHATLTPVATIFPSTSRPQIDDINATLSETETVMMEGRTN